MSRATSGSAPSFTVRPHVVCRDHRCTTPSWIAVARTAWRICSENRWWSSFGKKRGSKSGRSGPPVHDDLVGRIFTAEAPNRLWLTDIERHEALLNRVEVSVPRQEVGRSFSRSKLGMVGSAVPRCTSFGRFQARASCGRIVLYSMR